jgi:hypothetical protein
MGLEKARAILIHRNEKTVLDQTRLKVVNGTSQRPPSFLADGFNIRDAPSIEAA